MLTRLKQIRFRNDIGFLCLLSSAHKYSSFKNKKLRSKLSICNYRAEYQKNTRHRSCMSINKDIRHTELWVHMKKKDIIDRN